ncbi:hypothetical protein CJF30_00011022 [Rutstroemia sp. NJR-2017a BBW]|nr:hypothetical protein CJF30_00011022 [Rutstroemia sp. NJR-2017a BBW]
MRSSESPRFLTPPWQEKNTWWGISLHLRTSFSFLGIGQLRDWSLYLLVCSRD